MILTRNTLLLFLFWVDYSISSTGLSSYREGPTFVREPDGTVDFSNNTGAQLECSGRGSPSPHVQWMLSDGSHVTDVPRIRRVLSNGTLLFPPFGAEEYRQDVHAAVYRCQLSNSAGAILSRDVWVRAVVMQLYEVQVYDEFVISGNTGVLRCHIPSFVTDYVSVTSWLHDSVYNMASGTSIKNGGKFTILPTGELHIKDVTMNDGLTSFRCRTYHRLTKETRSSSTSGRLVVTAPQGSVPPRITDSKLNVQIGEGEETILPCAAQGHPPPSYTWFRQHQGSQIARVVGDDRLQVNGGSLIILRSLISDSGLYTCAVNNSIGNEKAETTLIVTASLSARVQPQQQVVDLGRSASLHCTTSGFPVTSIRWLKDGRPVDSTHIRTSTPEILQVMHLRREDMGMYQCVVKNSVQTVHATAEIKIGDAAPEFHETFDEQSVHPGSAVSLVCVVSGNPPPSVLWTVDESILSSSERNVRGEIGTRKGELFAYLNISNIQTADGGEYKCRATNAAGNIEHSARINVYGSPAIRMTGRISAMAGVDTNIHCPYYGYPIESVSWERDSLKLPVNRRQRVFPNGTLVIQNVQPELDAGKYTCVVRNPQGQDARRDIDVMVVVPPMIAAFSFQGEQFVEGMRTRATCYVSKGDLPITITWMKGGLPLSTQAGVGIRVIDEYSSILTIDNVAHAHSGNYTCVAKNSVAMDNFTAKLVVNVPPRWLNEPRDASALVGQQIMLNCQAQGSPNPIITWMKSEGTVSGDYREIIPGNSRVSVAPNGSLVINGVSEMDDGQYICQAANGVGAGLSRVIRFKIHVPPYFVEMNKNYTVRRGDDARLLCDARGDAPIKILWLMNGSRLPRPGETSFRFSVTFQQTGKGVVSELLIRKTERHDNAHFSCLANNSFGSGENSLYLLVQQIPEPPRAFKLVSVKSRSVQLSWSPPYDGNSAIMRYIIEHKELKESWELATPVVLSAQETMTNIFGLQPDRSYHLRAKAENAVGLSLPTDVLTFTTHEEAPGGAPRNLQVTSLDSQTLKVTWKPPSKEVWFGDILGYNIGFRPQNSSHPFTFRKMEVYNANDATLHFLVTGLKKFTRYVVVVQAFNRHGNGPSSDQAFARTQEDVPSKPPQSVQCVTLSSQSIKVSWDAPSSADTNGLLLGYKVVYKPVSSWFGLVLPKTQSTSESSVTLFALETFADYSIQVLAFTRVGDGATSDAVNCTTAEDVPDAPADIKAVASSADTIVVSWKAPLRSRGSIVRYTVYVRSLDGTKEETSKYTVPSTQYSFVAEGLRKNRRHEFWVTASTIIGEGQSTRVVAQAPAAKVGAKITSFDEIMVSRWKTNVTLPCKSVGVPPPEIDWTVSEEALVKTDRLQVTSDGSLWILEVLASDAANYTCKVRNAYGSDSITHKLRIQAPPNPPTISVSSIGLKSIQVQWAEPDVVTAPILGYSLSFRREYGEWEELQISPDEYSRTLDNLWCGTRYQLYMTAYSTVGPGKPSDIIKVQTKGSAPIAPAKHDVVLENVTSVTVLLDGWHSDGCPILYFIIEYRLKSVSEWTLLSNHVKPHQERFPVGDLHPKTRYQLRITAHNNAGSSKTEYEFTTQDSFVLGAAPGLVVTRESKGGVFYSDLKVILPTVCALLIVITAISTLCLFIRRKRESIHNRETETVKMNSKYALVLERGMAFESKSNPNTQNSDSVDTQRINNSCELYHCSTTFSDEVCPYATFQLAGLSRQQSEYGEPSPVGADRRRSTPSLRMSEEVTGYHKMVQNSCPERSPYSERVPDLLYRESSSSNDSSPHVSRSSLGYGTYHRRSSLNEQRYSYSPYSQLDDLVLHCQEIPPPYYSDVNCLRDVVAKEDKHFKKLTRFPDHSNFASVIRRHEELSSSTAPCLPSKKDYSLAV